MGQAAEDALVFSAAKLIPVLFPFAVLSRFLLLSGLLDHAARLLTPLARPLALSGVSLPALLTGLFCGFPMGAFSAAALWEKRKIEKEEAIRLAAFGGNAGAAFLFGTTSALFECPNAGALLFAAQTASSLLVGLFLASRQKKKGALNPSHPFVAEKVPLLPLAADCVVKSGLAMLSVTAFVVFFAVITAALGEIAVLAPLLPFFSAFLETSTAVKSASALVGAYGLRPMLTLAAFSVGFTGLSVFLQAESLFHGELPLSYLVKVRLAIALLSAAITFLFCPLL